MSEVYILPTAELACRVESLLFPLLGDAILLADKQVFIETCMLESFSDVMSFPTSECDISMERLLEDYQLTSELKERVIKTLVDGLEHTILSAVVNFYSHKAYSCEFNSLGDTYIHVTEVQVRRKDPEAELLQRSKEELESGAWYPETYRRRMFG